MKNLFGIENYNSEFKHFQKSPFHILGTLTGIYLYIRLYAELYHRHVFAGGINFPVTTVLQLPLVVEAWAGTST